MDESATIHAKPIAITPGGILDATSETQILINMYRTIARKSMILVPRGSQNQPKLCPGERRKRSWKQVGSGTPKKCQRQVRGTPFLAPLGRFWAPLGVNLAPSGGPRMPKWIPKSSPDRSKWCPGEGLWQKLENLIESCLEIVSFWMCWAHRNVYI